MISRLALLPLAGIVVFATDLRVGQGAAKITPPVGIPMAGYYSVRLAEGTHDDLYAKAIVLEMDGKKAAMVACDLIGVPADIVEAARKLIEAQTGIPAGQAMISATHSHTGPLLDRRFYGALTGAPLKIAEQYRASLPAKIAVAVKVANTTLQPSRALSATGKEESISFYRRFLMKDGSVKTNPGKMNPEIVQPMAEIDPDVAVIEFESSGKPLAIAVNFALHLDTVGGTQFSADYPFTLDKVLGKLYGPDVLTLFTIGAAGNINHVNVKNKEPQKGQVEARRIGTILAGEVVKTMARMKPVAVGELRLARETVKLPIPKFTSAEIEQAKSTAAQFGKKPTLEMAQAFKVLEVSSRKGAPWEVDVQVIALGDKVAWVGLPGEVFTELGQAIKKASPYPQTIVVELANASIHYVPTRKAFQEGGYETINSWIAPGGGELLAETALQLLAATYRGGR